MFDFNNKNIGPHLKISNKGEIDANAFKLIGASTKKGDGSKIGFFGSGLKYAIAYFMRNDYKLRIFSGQKEIKLSTKTTKFRDQEFKAICINGDKTSITTEMGVKWKLWFALREIYCNALDEEGSSITKVDSILKEDDLTSIYIPLTPDLQKIINNWNDYFSDKRTDIVQKYAGCTIYKRTGANLVVYRKGIRCWDQVTQSIFHYDFDAAQINESRVIESEWIFKTDLLKSLLENANVVTIKEIYKQLAIKGVECFEYDFTWAGYGSLMNPCWLEAIGGVIVVPYETAGFYMERVGDRDHILLPGKLIIALKNQFGDKIKTVATAGQDYIEINPSKKQEYLKEESLRFFKDAGYEITYDIKVAKFESSNTLGFANIETNEIILSDKVFESGRKEILATIFEENEHLETNLSDCTRQFQDHLITKVISQMEEKVGIFN